MGKLSEHEKVTVIKFNEGSREAVIYTFNADLKRMLEEFAGKYPLFCHLESFTEEGGASYVIDKSRLSIRLVPPSCEERRAAARAYAEEYGLQAVQSGRELA